MEENLNSLACEALLNRYVKILTAYNAVRSLYKAWRREIRPQLANCIEFKENSFTVTCPKEKLRQIDTEFRKKLKETLAMVLGRETTIIDGLIRAVKDMSYPLTDFEEPLRMVLRRAESMLYKIMLDKYFDALDTILTCGDQPGAEC